MKILVIGATGRAGTAVYAEAKRRGHDVTGLARTQEKGQQKLGDDAQLLIKDAFDLTQDDILQYDAIVDALGVPWGSGLGYLHLDLAGQLIHQLRNQPQRLIVIVGSSSLVDPQTGRVLMTEFPPSVKEQPWYDIAINQYREYQLLTMVDNVNWTAISPGENFATGPATSYRRGTNELLKNSNGESIVSTGNMALAVLDELENPKAIHGHFTVEDV